MIQYLQQEKKVNEVNFELKQIEAKIKEINFDKKKTIITSPVKGKVFNLIPQSVGYASTLGENLMNIVPDGEVEAKVFLSNNDVGFLRQEMEADIRIDAYPFTQFGSIKGNLKFKDGEPNDSDLDKEKTVGEIEETIPVKAIGADQNKKKDDSPIKQDHPPSIPSLKVQKKAKEIDRAELERIRDKRYEEGAQSLTEEENQILSLASARDKKSQPIQFKKATNFNQAQDKRAPNKTIKDEQNIVTIGCRGIFGIITAIVGLQALGNGWLVVSIVTFGIAWYLLRPVIEKFK